METPFLAIHGRGLLPGLLALDLLSRDLDQPLLLLSPDQTICGEHLEPVVADRLSAAARQLINPFVVAEWPGYYVVRGGQHDLHEEPVLLLDPVQVWLELQALLPSAALVAQCGPVTQSDQRIWWTGGSALLGRLIDLAPLLGAGDTSEIVGLDAVQSLTLPVLADYDAACAQWSAHQYLPLGDQRLVIRKLARADNLIGQHSTFEALLNGLISP